MGDDLLAVLEKRTPMPSTGPLTEGTRPTRGSGPEEPEHLRDAPAPEGTAPPRERAYRTSYTLTELMAADFPEPDWLVETLFPAVGLMLLGGRPKRGKSTLARQLAASLGVGGMFLGHQLKPGKVLYICLEERPKSIQDKMRKLGVLQADDVHFEFSWLPLNQGGLQRLRDYAEGQKPALIVLDTLSRAYGGKIDWNDQGAVTALLDPLQHLAFDCQCLIIAIDHLGKAARNSADPDPVDDMIASTAKVAIADDILALYRKRGEGTTLVGIGRNIGEVELPLYFDRETECYQPAEGPRPDSLQGLILAYLKEHGQATTKELAEALDRHPGSINETLMQLCDKAVVLRGQRKGHSVYYELVKDDSSQSSESYNLPNDTILQSSRLYDSEDSVKAAQSSGDDGLGDLYMLDGGMTEGKGAA